LKRALISRQFQRFGSYFRGRGDIYYKNKKLHGVESGRFYASLLVEVSSHICVFASEFTDTRLLASAVNKGLFASFRGDEGPAGIHGAK
jgi:hypothetical protein